MIMTTGHCDVRDGGNTASIQECFTVASTLMQLPHDRMREFMDRLVKDTMVMESSGGRYTRGAHSAPAHRRETSSIHRCRCVVLTCHSVVPSRMYLLRFCAGRYKFDISLV
jgi:hypothetical protein